MVRPRRTTTAVPRREGPPALDLGLLRTLRLLVLINVIPIGGALIVGIGIATGRMKLVAGAEDSLVLMAVAIAGCALLAFAAWVIRPIGRWLRDYPVWCFRHRSRLAWAVPAAAGWLAWAALWIAGALGCGAALVLIATALWRLFMR